jgi:hypothetical protein
MYLLCFEVSYTARILLVKYHFIISLDTHGTNEATYILFYIPCCWKYTSLLHLVCTALARSISQYSPQIQLISDPNINSSYMLTNSQVCYKRNVESLCWGSHKPRPRRALRSGSIGGLVGFFFFCPVFEPASIHFFHIILIILSDELVAPHPSYVHQCETSSQYNVCLDSTLPYQSVRLL